jgi:hypothetical protein
MTDEEMDKFDEQRSLAMNTFSEVPYFTPSTYSCPALVGSGAVHFSVRDLDIMVSFKQRKLMFYVSNTSTPAKNSL